MAEACDKSGVDLKSGTRPPHQYKIKPRLKGPRGLGSKPKCVSKVARHRSMGKGATGNSGILVNELLPDDVLLMFFSHLDFPHRMALERVCKKWQLLVTQSLLTVKIIDFGEYFSNRHRFKFILTDDILQKVLRLCSNAVDIRIWENVQHKLTPKAIDYLSEYGQTLKKIDFTANTGNKFVFRKFAKAQPNIEEVSFVKCDKIEDEAFDLMVKELKNLKNFALHDCPQFSGNCFYQITPGLERLELVKCPNTNVSNLAKIADRCPNLTALLLNDIMCARILETVLPNILTKSVNLKLLVIEYKSPEQLGKQSLKAMASLKQLEIINVDRMTCVPLESDVFRQLCFNNVHLKELRLPLANDLTDDSFEYFCKLTELEHLSITCAKITDVTLTNMSKYNKNLKRLKISSALLITSKGCASIMASCNKLNFFSLDQCPLITIDTVVSAIAAAQTRTADDPFLSLTLSHCKVTTMEARLLKTPANLHVMCFGTEGHNSSDHLFDSSDDDDIPDLYFDSDGNMCSFLNNDVLSDFEYF